jgi:hypothetical protein
VPPERPYRASPDVAAKPKYDMIGDMRGKHVSMILASLLLMAGCRGESVSPTPAVTSTVQATPSPRPTDTTTPAPSATPALSATPAPTTTPDVSCQPSKYEDVFVYTIEENHNEGRSTLHVAYPVTEQPAINECMETIAQAFIDEFHTVAAEQEEAYQEYVRETGEEAASFVTHYVQQFDVTAADANLMSLAIEQSRGTGGTGSTEVTGYVFDRQTGVELTLDDLFVGDTYLERLSTLSRAELERLARIEMEGLDFSSEAAREEWWAGRVSMIEQGTAPQPENFDGVLFLEDGTLRIMFDKYQVGPGAAGVVTIELPVEDVADILAPQMRQLLGLEAAASTATALPSPSPTPSPTSAPGATDGEQTAGDDTGRIDRFQGAAVGDRRGADGRSPDSEG